MFTNSPSFQQFTKAASVPAGYWVDAKGAFIPVKVLKPIDMARDQLVGEIVTKAIELNRLMAQFKESTFAYVAAFVDLSASEYDVKLGVRKGISRSTALTVNTRSSVRWRSGWFLMSGCRPLRA